MSDCTTCKHCENCDTFFSCELHPEVNEKPNLYFWNSCNDYEEQDDGFVLTQVWDWR